MKQAQCQTCIFGLNNLDRAIYLFINMRIHALTIAIDLFQLQVITFRKILNCWYCVFVFAKQRAHKPAETAD